MTFTYTDPVFLATLALAGCAAMLCLAMLGAPIPSLTGEYLATARKRSFYDKFGKQMASLGFRLLCCVLLALTGAVGYLAATAGDPLQVLQGLAVEVRSIQVAFAAACGLAGVTIFSALHLFTWKKLKKKKPLHKFLGILSVLAALGLLTLLVGGGRSLFHALAAFPAQPAVGTALEQVYILHAYSPVWPLAAQTLLLAMGAAGGTGCIHLLLRRTTEDFGRDYYTFTMAHAARWAWIPTVLQLAAQGWLGWLLYQRMGGFDQAQPALLFLAGSAAGFLAAAMLWMWVSRSQTPLRLKPAVIFALLLFALALSAEGYPLLKALQSMPASGPGL